MNPQCSCSEGTPPYEGIPRVLKSDLKKLISRDSDLSTYYVIIKPVSYKPVMMRPSTDKSRSASDKSPSTTALVNVKLAAAVVEELPSAAATSIHTETDVGRPSSSEFC